MMKGNKSLLIAAIAAGETVRSAAASANMSLSTAKRCLDDPGVSLAIEQASLEITRQWGSRSRTLRDAAMARLATFLDGDHEPHVVLRAIEIAVRQASHAHVKVLHEKIALLERRLSKFDMTGPAGRVESVGGAVTGGTAGAMRRVDRLLDAFAPTERERADAACDRLENGGRDWADWELLARDFVPSRRRAAVRLLPLACSLASRDEYPVVDRFTASILNVLRWHPGAGLPAEAKAFKAQLRTRWRTEPQFDDGACCAGARLVLGPDGGDGLRRRCWSRHRGRWHLHRDVIQECAGDHRRRLSTVAALPDSAATRLERFMIATSSAELVRRPSNSSNQEGRKATIRSSGGVEYCETDLDLAVLLDLPYASKWLAPPDYPLLLRPPDSAAREGQPALEDLFQDMLFRRMLGSLHGGRFEGPEQSRMGHRSTAALGVQNRAVGCARLERQV